MPSPRLTPVGGSCRLCGHANYNHVQTEGHETDDEMRSVRPCEIGDCNCVHESTWRQYRIAVR